MPFQSDGEYLISFDSAYASFNDCLLDAVMPWMAGSQPGIRFSGACDAGCVSYEAAPWYGRKSIKFKKTG
ncbi:hypothetical protein [Burkholderia glumae]|uniref:hypothetical protein n=1 Tax=Burkholderia glumae TaxID=337 RepID=UPI00157AB126|nr:hypothetical protein [Burkholderia glumae]